MCMCVCIGRQTYPSIVLTDVLACYTHKQYEQPRDEKKFRWIICSFIVRCAATHRDLHIARAEHRRAGVATGDGHDGREHRVLDEGACEDEGNSFAGRSGLCRVHTGSLSKALTVGLLKLDCLIRPVVEGSTTLDGSATPATKLLGQRTRSSEQPRSHQCLSEANLDMAVLLFVIDEKVHEAFRIVFHAVRHGHHVELTDLGEALEHLHRLLLCLGIDRKEETSA